MKLKHSTEFQTKLLVFQLIAWPMMILLLYHTGFTPYWFDNQAQESGWSRVMGTKTYSASHRHNPYTDSRFDHLSATYQIVTVEGILTGISSNGVADNWRLQSSQGETESYPVIFDPEKTIVHCTQAKEVKLGQLECPLSDIDCEPNQEGSLCGDTNQEKLRRARVQDNIRIKNLYRYNELGDLIHSHTQFIQLD
jgi:hypothetical protein